MTHNKRGIQTQREHCKRMMVLDDIRIANIKRQPYDSYVSIAYIIGRYNIRTDAYEYLNSFGFGLYIEVSRLFDTSKKCNTCIQEKLDGSKYMISKVFVRTLRLLDRSDNIVDKITLTKYNHYQLLSEIVNDI